MKRAILLIALAIPSVLAAQSGELTVSSYVAADGGISGGPVLVGASVARERGRLGVRGEMAVDAGSTLASSASRSGKMGVLSADLDALLYLGGLVGTGAVTPYLLAGVGGRMLSGASTETGANWGYGVGARMPVTDRIGMQGELRYREPVGAAAPLAGTTAGQSAGLEYRFGLSVRLGGGRARSTLPAPAPVSRPVSMPMASSTATNSAAAAARRRIAERALDTADDYLGVKYTWGGTSPQDGFDCSGFVRFVFTRQGIDLPRVSRDQARVGTPLPLDIDAFEPGDLIAFAPEEGTTVDHIAIYAGNGRIIHSSSSGHGVRFDDLYGERGKWYRTHMVAARRVIDAPVFFGAE